VTELEPVRAGHLHRLRRQIEGIPGSHRDRVPQDRGQLCIVHLVRYSLNYVSWKLRKKVAADLRTIYSATTVEDAEQQLAEFEEKWGEAYPPIVQSWRRNWARIIPFFDYPPEIRKVIYTTNAIESVNMSLRKITKNRGSFPSDEALLKLFYLALNNISKKVDDAKPRLEVCAKPVYHPVRGSDVAAVEKTPFTQNSVHPRRTVRLSNGAQSMHDG
jgi:transposase-like protein